MKKRAMKKYIPKNTFYCYARHSGTFTPCKWYSTNENKNKQDNGFCRYIGSGDWQAEYTSLLFDMCKECGVSYFKFTRKITKKRPSDWF